MALESWIHEGVNLLISGNSPLTQPFVYSFRSQFEATFFRFLGLSRVRGQFFFVTIASSFREATGFALSASTYKGLLQSRMLAPYK